MLVAGVDDAGRGPVIGPLVIAGVLFHDSQIPKLQALGAKDSKALTPSRREALSPEIKRLAVQWKVLEFSPAEVDKVVLEGTKLRRLNWFEAVAMAEVIKRLRPETAYVDASDVVEARFAQQIRELVPFEVNVIAEHHADAKYTVVGAASIIAKVHRDEVIASLRERYGDLGSGYPSDPRTKEFLSRWIREKRDFPNFVRKSWKTSKRLMEKEGQLRLDDDE